MCSALLDRHRRHAKAPPRHRQLKGNTGDNSKSANQHFEPESTLRLSPCLSQMCGFRVYEHCKVVKREQPATQPAIQSVSSQPASRPNQSVGRSAGRTTSQPAKRPTVANRFGHVISSRWLCVYSCKRILPLPTFKPRAD